MSFRIALNDILYICTALHKRTRMGLCAPAYLKKCAHFSDFRSCPPLDLHSRTAPILYAKSTVREKGRVWSTAYTVFVLGSTEVGVIIMQLPSDNVIHKKITQVTVKG